MLKSEALGQLSAIADDDNRDFEDFAAAYKTMEEVVKEYPELSHYVLPIVVQTAADKGFNADIRPAAARVFNAAALNLRKTLSKTSFALLNAVRLLPII